MLDRLASLRSQRIVHFGMMCCHRSLRTNRPREKNIQSPKQWHSELEIPGRTLLISHLSPLIGNPFSLTKFEPGRASAEPLPRSLTAPADLHNPHSPKKTRCCHCSQSRKLPESAAPSSSHHWQRAN